MRSFQRKAGLRITNESQCRPLAKLDDADVLEVLFALLRGHDDLRQLILARRRIRRQEALTQAERYSGGLTPSAFDFNGFQVPFLYSTNGEVIWHHDVRHPLNRSHHANPLFKTAPLGYIVNSLSGRTPKWLGLASSVSFVTTRSPLLTWARLCGTYQCRARVLADGLAKCFY